MKRRNGLLAVTATERAEALNDFFATTFTVEDTSSIPDSDGEQFTGEHLNTFEITPVKVLKKLQDLNPGKTPGLDGWHPLFLKNVADLIAELCVYAKTENVKKSLRCYKYGKSISQIKKIVTEVVTN